MQISLIGAAVLLLTTLNTVLVETKEPHLCPIGFSLAHTEEKIICYKLKDPETFDARFDNCAGNLYSSQAFRSLPPNITRLSLWTEHKSIYPDGPYIDFSFTPTSGNVLDKTFEVTYDKNVNRSEELCLIINEENKYEAVSCKSKYYRYCFVEPYKENDTMAHEGCEGLAEGYLRFYSPSATCLMYMSGIKLNWKEARAKCMDFKGTLLYDGWRYANNPKLRVNKNALYPMEAIVVGAKDKNDSTKWIQTAGWKEDSLKGIVLALQNNERGSVFYTKHFSEVICERSIQLTTIQINLTINNDLIHIHTSDSIALINKNLKCFSDSQSYWPRRIAVTSNAKHMHLKPVGNGYHWCTHIDSLNYRVSESNKLLYIEERNEKSYVYALKVKLRQEKKYSLSLLNRDLFRWKNNLQEYIYQENKGLLSKAIAKEEIEVRLKRIYMDRMTILLHVEWDQLFNVSLGASDLLDIISVKPVYYCKETKEVSINRIKYPKGVPLGLTTTNESGCKIYRCEGDFNEGVQWEVYDDRCTTSSTTSSTTPTTIKPTTSEPTTESDAAIAEEVKEVMHEVNQLLHNDSIAIDVRKVVDVVKKVDELLESEEKLNKIPASEDTSGLLNQIEQIAVRVDLNQSTKAAIVTNNIAVLVAVASPENPVRGLTIASQGDQSFNEHAFEFVYNKLNSTQRNTKACEAAVQIPESIANTSRKISFVIFRDDRAFKTAENQVVYAVNSRVLSISIENLTEFENGETINIHLRRSGSPRQNETLTCAFWKFSDNHTGHWSQEGCTFIPAEDNSTLDVCQCNHLTHFAEILIPRSGTLFTEKNENALEIISIVGCLLSLLGLIAIGLTALTFSSWRKELTNKIWLNLCIAVAVLISCFIIVVFKTFEAYDSSCIFVGALLHYSVLASFSWMSVAAIMSYRRLVLIFNMDLSNELLKYAVFCWGAPGIVVGIVITVPNSYAGRFDNKMLSGSFCYPSGLTLYMSVYAPILIMVLLNWVLFISIVRSVFAKRNPLVQRYGDRKEAIKCAKVSFLLFYLFGLPWVFGLGAHNVICAYLFNLTATFQGVILFIFFVVANKKTRDLWLNKCKDIKTSKMFVTYSSNLTGQNSRFESLDSPEFTGSLGRIPGLKKGY